MPCACSPIPERQHGRFLHDYKIPATNNTAERYLRNYKRKQKQAMTFRSFAAISMLIKIRKKDGANVFREVAQRFEP